MRKENAKNSTESVNPEKEGGETFLGRWSRRKQRARREPEDALPKETSASNAPTADPTEETAPERILTDDDMPLLESLDADSDYSGFLSPGVSESLRNAALRKMFLSPKFNIVDGLDDYAEDFTRFEALGDMITADMRHQMELAEERVKKAMEDELAESGETTTEPVAGAENGEVRDGKETPAASATQPADAKNGQADGADFGDPTDDGTRSG